MKKFFLIVFILVDLGVMGAAGAFLYTYVDHKKAHTLKSVTRPSSVTPLPIAPILGGVKTSTAAVAVTPTPNPVPAMTASPYRNIVFSYKNVKARQVLIRADFTGWKGVPMKRDAHGLWTFTQQLIPGEYAYCFTVDDKIIRDPANKHTKLIAQTQVSSITIAKPPVKVEP